LLHHANFLHQELRAAIRTHSSGIGCAFLTGEGWRHPYAFRARHDGAISRKQWLIAPSPYRSVAALAYLRRPSSVVLCPLPWTPLGRAGTRIEAVVVLLVEEDRDSAQVRVNLGVQVRVNLGAGARICKTGHAPSLPHVTEWTSSERHMNYLTPPVVVNGLSSPDPRCRPCTGSSRRVRADHLIGSSAEPSWLTPYTARARRRGVHRWRGHPPGRTTARR